MDPSISFYVYSDNSNTQTAHAQRKKRFTGSYQISSLYLLLSPRCLLDTFRLTFAETTLTLDAGLLGTRGQNSGPKLRSGRPKLPLDLGKSIGVRLLPYQVHIKEQGSHDEDQVIAEYDIFVTAPLQEQVMLFQYPNRDRDQPYNTPDEQPRQLRIKPNSGFIELDILQSGANITMDSAKAQRWADALQLAKERKVDQYGLATGFGRALKMGDAAALLADAPKRGGANAGGGASGLGGASFEKHDNVQTLGGLVVRPEPGQPLYMQGVFRGDEVHLTPLAGYVQMRPQFHHLDAEARQESLAASRYAAASSASAGAGTTKEERITMSMQVARSAGETDEEISAQKTTELLARVADEPWSRLECFHEDSEVAFETYENKCFLKEEEQKAQRLVPTLSEFGYLKSVASGTPSKTRSLGPSGRGSTG